MNPEMSAMIHDIIAYDGNSCLLSERHSSCGLSDALQRSFSGGKHAVSSPVSAVT